MSDYNQDNDMPQALKDMLNQFKAEGYNIKGFTAAKPKSEETITEAASRTQVDKIIREYTKVTLENMKDIAANDTPLEEWKASGMADKAAQMQVDNLNACVNRIMLALKAVK